MLILMRFGIKLDEIDFFEITGRGYLRSIERRIDRWKDLSPRLAARVHLSLFSQSLLRRENIRNLFTDITPRPYLFLAIRIHTAKQRRSLERSWYSLCATVDRQVVDKSLHKKNKRSGEKPSLCSYTLSQIYYIYKRIRILCKSNRSNLIEFTLMYFNTISRSNDFFFECILISTN